MLACLACYGERVATLLENTTTLRFCRASGDGEAVPEPVYLPAPLCALGLPRLRDLLADIGVDLLICGAINRQEEQALLSWPLTVESWVGGPADDIMQAWRGGRIATKRLPGCARNPDETTSPSNAFIPDGLTIRDE